MEEKAYLCSVCESTFNVEEHLKNHIKTHNSEKPFECESCRKRFARVDYLKRHENRHESKRKYDCKICGKCFNHMSNLKIHEKIHATDETIYKCKLCEASFKLKFHLNKPDDDQALTAEHKSVKNLLQMV